MVKIFPSILAADFSKLGDEIRAIDIAGANGVHIDVMDGVFVPNITFGMPVVKAIRKCSDLFYDVHLMIEKPEKYVKDFADAGADGITFHLESTENPFEVINMIRDSKKNVGVSVKPGTEIPSIDILRAIDMVLVMTVEPGFGGQKYIESMNRKIEDLARIRYENDLKFEISVDGGITFDTAKLAAKCGADILVAGNTVFMAQDMKECMKQLRECRM